MCTSLSIWKFSHYLFVLTFILILLWLGNIFCMISIKNSWLVLWFSVSSVLLTRPRGLYTYMFFLCAGCSVQLIQLVLWCCSKLIYFYWFLPSCLFIVLVIVKECSITSYIYYLFLLVLYLLHVYAWLHKHLELFCFYKLTSETLWNVLLLR